MKGKGAGGVKDRVVGIADGRQADAAIVVGVPTIIAAIFSREATFGISRCLGFRDIVIIQREGAAGEAALRVLESFEFEHPFDPQGL